MKNFRSYQLAVSFYHLSASMQLTRALKDQLQRAAASIVLNLAEGSGRTMIGDQRRFYEIALGSLREVQAILALAGNNQPKLVQAADALGAHIYLLVKSRR